MAEKVGVRAALIILLVLAGVLVLIGWFVWSYKAGHPVSTSPKATSGVTAPGPRRVVHS